MAPIEVRPLRQGQEKIWLGINLSAAAVNASLPDFTERVRRSRHDERTFLLAFDGQRCVGRLEGTFLNPSLYFVRELYASEGERAAETESALCAYLHDSFARDGVVVLTWDAAESEPVNAALLRSGFRVAKRKTYVEKSITGYESPYRDPFTYASLADVGRDAFVDNPNRDADREFRELVEYAGRRFDPSWWQVARLEGESIGVVLPQAFPKRADEGTLFYVGVRPAWRGRGHGKVLHAAGLQFLARHGVTKYVGSTDTRNAPMIAVFAANGCSPTGTQLFLDAVR